METITITTEFIKLQDLLKLAGMGVAMANAAPEVRAEADYITLSNEEDGVAAALEHFGM